MKFCANCGKELSDEATMCPHCCYIVSSTTQPTQKPTVEEPKASTGLVVLSVFLPIVGLILAIVKWRDTPRSAKKYLIAALIGWSVSFLLNILCIILGL